MYKCIKRVLDFIMALLLVIISSPVMLVVAILILIQRDGPVLFKQERPGKDGKIFLVHKFRTMSTITEKDGRELSDMERMSKLGSFLRKSSLDELPQFFDILSGKMSFIGPRPLMKSYLELYTPEQARRHEVLPGISGWAQINGRNSITWEEKFELDVYYVDNMSFGLDIKIFFTTIKNVLLGVGINSSDENTMESFRGTVMAEEQPVVIASNNE